MIPPTSIDGTDITGATIDGTDVTEITVDGTTVFSAAVPLPSSAVNQYKFDEGSGNTAFDSIGSLDLTNNNGVSYIADSDYVGGFYADFAGGNQDQHFSGAENPTLQRENAFSYACTIKPDALNNFGAIVWNGDTNANSFVITTDASVVGGFLEDGLGRLNQVDQNVSVNERARIVFTWDGSSTSTMYKNKSPSTTNDAGSFIRQSTGGGFFRIGLSNRDDQDYNGLIDNPVVYNSELTQAEVDQDFDAQPWTP